MEIGRNFETVNVYMPLLPRNLTNGENRLCPRGKASISAPKKEGGERMAQAMDANDLMGMSLDQISDRNLRVKPGAGAWSERAGGRTIGSGRDAGSGVGGGGMRSQQMQSARAQSVVTVPGGGTFRSAIASTRASQSSGPIRRAGLARSARDTAAPYQRPTRAPESVFDRLGESFLRTFDRGADWTSSGCWRRKIPETRGNIVVSVDLPSVLLHGDCM